MAARAEAIQRTAPTESVWVRWLMPSVSDVIFVALLCKLAFWSEQLLADADIGWHIRNGEHILSTVSVPRTDYFSYTMAGQPWYSWEWLYDVLVAGLNSLGGLNAVVLFSAILFAAIFMLVFRATLKSSGNLLIALLFTLLAGIASSVHLLARPHMLTWLFTLILLLGLRSFHLGDRKRVYFIPLLMALWVNLHGGFLAGVALIALFCLADLWTMTTTSHAQLRAGAAVRTRHLGWILLISSLATMATPYGLRLYGHLYQYLGNRYLMEHIAEFQSPDFHAFQIKMFAALLLIAFVVLGVERKRAGALDLLLVTFSAWIGLYAARNIPLATIILSVTLAPKLAHILRHSATDPDFALPLRRALGKIESFATRMAALELRFNRHLLAGIVLLAISVVSLTAGARPQKGLAVQFEAKRMPLGAAEFMATHGIRSHFFASDAWSGYLIYRLYPDVRVMMDDRHDFYGESYVREYLKIAQVNYGWLDALNKKEVNWVLASPDSGLANTLKLAEGWEPVYDDGIAIIFARKRRAGGGQ